MMKGIWFGGIHSHKDLNLILSEVSIPPAKPKTNYIDIPGADGSVDLTEANGEVKYSDRDCKFTFSMNPAGDVSEQAWEDRKTEVSNALNGLVFKITLDKDPDFFYFGRCTVDEYASDKQKRQIVVSAKVQPYKYKQNETVVTYALSSTAKTVIIKNARKPVCPIIECSKANSKVVFGASTFVLAVGENKLLDIRFVQGNNTLKISGSGTMTFRYQEGAL